MLCELSRRTAEEPLPWSNILTQGSPRGGERPLSPAESGLGVAEAARQMGVSRQTASKWLRRSRSGEGLGDRSSRPRRLARLTPPEAEERVAAARRELMLAPLGLAAATGVPARTCARIVARRGMPRLADVDRVTGEVRRRGPVTPRALRAREARELVHVDIKKVARIPDGGGWRARGGVRPRAPGLGEAATPACTSQWTTSAASPTPSCCPTSGRAPARRSCGGPLRFYAGLGLTVERVMTDNGPGYRSGEFNELLAAAGVRHVYTRPYSPWQNGKVERMNRTIAQEWQYGRAWESEAGRADALPAFIERYNWERPHSACGACRPCRASWV